MTKTSRHVSITNASSRYGMYFKNDQGVLMIQLNELRTSNGTNIRPLIIVIYLG